MSDTPLILAFDTSLPHCAAALMRGDAVVESVCEDMARGQVEALMPFLEALLARHGAVWRDLSRIGVGIGPGNFTGIRISVSAARGLALGLGVPALGVSTFDALRGGTEGLAAVPAPRGMAYLQSDADTPELMALEDVPDAALWPEDGAALAAGIARLAALRTPAEPPAPLYLRPADAAPPRDAPPIMLD
jgi:tRNA threonylcarbamoyl adenosine modification protein YeaZ